jgi:hypothetical protein
MRTSTVALQTRRSSNARSSSTSVQFDGHTKTNMAAIRTPSSSTSTSIQRKVDDLFKRMQPHSIVQTYDKAMSMLKPEPEVVVNGVPLQPMTGERGPLRAKWEAQQSKRSISTAPISLHYARCQQYEPPTPSLSLDTWTTLQVIVSSASSATSYHSSTAGLTKLTKRSWQCVAETDRKIGLALYALSLGPWNGSSLIALVWTQSLEIVQIFVQLHVSEVLYTCPPRAMHILPDDVDPKYGLHSYTAALTLRDLDGKSFWETECYAIEFSLPVATTTQTVSVELLTTKVRI